MDYQTDLIMQLQDDVLALRRRCSQLEIENAELKSRVGRSLVEFASDMATRKAELKKTVDEALVRLKKAHVRRMLNR